MSREKETFIRYGVHLVCFCEDSIGEKIVRGELKLQHKSHIFGDTFTLICCSRQLDIYVRKVLQNILVLHE